LAGILMVTVVFNLWGFPFISMIPVIGKEILVLNSFYVGLLMGAEGCGALIGALLIAGAGQPRHYRKLYISGLGLYLVMAIMFSQSTSSVGSGVCFAWKQRLLLQDPPRASTRPSLRMKLIEKT
jgi:hypothetical protein